MADPTRHVLLVSGRLGVFGDGGPYRPLLDRLEAQGISAEVLCPGREDGADPDSRVFERPGLGSRWLQALAVRQLGIGDAIRRPDLLHVLQSSVGPAGLAIAEHWRIPYVQTVEEFLGPHERLRLSRRWCRRLVPVSRELADDLRLGLGVPPAMLSVVFPGLAPDGTGAGPSASRPSRVPVIGTAGPMVPSSGFGTFLAAARRVVDAGVDAEFVIAGQGQDEVDLRRCADRLKIADRVTFADQPGFGPRIWNVLDVFCQTTLVPTVGRSLARAMGAGVPSIATDLVGLRALIVDDLTGMRVPPGDSSALARTILGILNEPERARRLGERGREAVRRHFHPDDEAYHLASLYRSVLGAGDVREAGLVSTA